MKQNFFATPDAMPFFEKFPCGLIILSDYKISKINPAALKIIGAEKEELIGKSISEWLDEDGKEIMEKLLRNEKKEATISLQVKNKILTANCFSEGGDILIVLNDMEEIEKERKKKQEIIHALNEKLKELKCLHMIETISQNNSSIDDMMEKIASVLPTILQHPELAACNIRVREKNYSYPDGVEMFKSISEEIVIDGRVEGNIEVGYVQPIPSEGEEIFLEEEKEALRHIAARIASILEYMEAKEELERSKEYFQKLVEESTDIIMVIDENTNIEYISPSIKNIFGYKPEEIVGRSSLEFVHPDDLQIAIEKFGEVIMNPEKVVTTVFRARHKNGEWRFVEVKGRNLLENPFVGGIIVNFHDITELKKSEEKIRLLFDATNDFVVLLAEDGTILDLNEAMAKYLGKKREELIGDNIKRYLPEDVYNRRFEVAKEVKKSKKAAHFIDSRNGRWFENRFYPILDENGNVVQIAAFVRDITEEKAREEEIREKSRQLRTLIDATHDLVLLVKPDGTIVDLNEAMAKAMRGRREDFIGKDVRNYKDIIPADVFEKKIEKAYEAIKTKRPVRFIDHPRKWYDNHYYPILDENGNVIMLAMFSRDITEIKEMEEKLQQLAENANEWIWEVDSNGVYTYSSPAIEKILGYKPEEIVGKKHFYDLFHPDEREKLKEEAMKIFEERKPFRNFINKNIHKNGEERWLVTSGVPVFDINGNWIGYRGMDLDITELKKAQDEIRRLNRFLDSIIENANVWIDVLDREGNVVIWNKAAENISGYSKGEVIGNNKIWNWLYPDEEYRKKIFSKAMDIIEKGEIVEDFETIITTKDGEKKIISWHSKRLLDEEGRIVGSVALGRDVTKHKETEKLAKTLMNATHDLMLLAKPDGTILDLNEAMARSLGKKREDIIGTNIKEHLPPDVYERRTAKVKEVERKKKEVRFIDSRNGRWFDNCFYPVFDEHGNVRYIAVFTRDITEERKMEEEMRKFKTIADNANYGVVIFDMEGNISYVNENFASAHGYSIEEIIGKNISLLSSNHLSLSHLKEKIMEKGYATGEIWQMKKNGEEFPMLAAGIFIKSAEEAYIAVTAIDITEKKRIEEKLQQHRKLTALGRLAAVVAHELNTPLANISITADYLMEKAKNCKEEVEIIKKEVENAANIIKNILNFSRAKITEKKEVNLRELIDRVIENIRRIYGADDTIFQNRMKDCVVHGNEERLFECFMNIVKNAVMAKDSTKETHYVIVDAVEKNGMVEVMVKDNGVGMDERVRKEATKPFFTTRKMGEGVGLGLFIANWVAEEHGGKIEIKSEKGKGTEVRVRMKVK